MGENGVSVTEDEAASVGLGIVATAGTGLDHLVGAVVSNNFVPESVDGGVFVINPVVGCAGEGLESNSGVAAFDVLVVAMVLGEGLFKDGSPERGVVSDVREKSGVARAPGAEGKVVIDDDGVGEAKGVEVDGVDSVGGKSVSGVDKDLLEAAWDLGECGSSGKEPAVAEGTLLDVLRGDALITEQGVVAELLTSASPFDHGFNCSLHVVRCAI